MLTPKLKKFLTEISHPNIPDDRKKTLWPLVDFIQGKIDRNEKIRLNFICTHNSRRSHLAQVWAQVMAYYFGIEKVFCYSGGTMATAVFPAVIQTLEREGFQTTALTSTQNPIYSIKFSDNEPSVIGFSKTWDNSFNPKSSFAAIMTCAQADAGCPFIAGAKKRIALTYDDPKKFDNSPQEIQKYKQTSHLIANELFYVFSELKHVQH